MVYSSQWWWMGVSPLAGHPIEQQPQQEQQQQQQVRCTTVHNGTSLPQQRQ
jgi:hypothetical protein